MNYLQRFAFTYCKKRAVGQYNKLVIGYNKLDSFVQLLYIKFVFHINSLKKLNIQLKVPLFHYFCKCAQNNKNTKHLQNKAPKEHYKIIFLKHFFLKITL